MQRPNRVKEVRRERGLTALELANQLEVREQTIYAYESGRITPSLDVARRLAEALSSTVEELFPPAPAVEATA
jgi:DNA-binding XRE family transcriptional regulator